MLIDAFMTDCILMEKKRVSDGAGGFLTQWTEGEPFSAAIVCDQSMQARVAQQEGMKSVYTVTTRKDVALEFHDVIRRQADGQTFRITSDGNDKESPLVGTLNMRQVTAEKWELTT